MSVEYNGKTYEARDKLKLPKLGIKSIKDIKGLDKLISLINLDLDNNSISEINGLDNLKNLEVLSLQHNNIKEIQGLENLVNLQKIYLYGNPVYDWIVDKYGKKYKNNAQILVEYCYEKQDITIEDEDYKLIEKVLKFEFDNQRKVTKAEMIRELNFSIEDLGKYFKILNQKVSYSKEEEPDLRAQTEGIIKTNPSPTLYDLMITFKLDYISAIKLGQYLIEKKWIKDFQNFLLKDKIVIEKDSEEKIKQLIKVAERLKLEIKGKILEAENKLKLQKLRIRNIKDLEGLDKLISLKNLDLDDNLITEINGLDNLKNLEVLSLQNNNIKEVQGLENLVNLKKIYLYGNPVYKWVIDNYGKKYRNNAQILVEYCSNKQKVKAEGLVERGPIEKIETREEIAEHKKEDLPVKLPSLDEEIYDQDIELIKKVLKFEYDNQRKILKTEMINKLDFTMDDVERYYEIIEQKVDVSKGEKQELKNYAESIIKQFPSPTLYDLIITLQFNYKKARKIGQFLIKEGWIRNFPDFHLKEEKLVEKHSIEKVKKMAKVSDRIKLDMMRKALKLDEEIFIEKIFEWAEKFDFRIDADMLIINKEKMGDFYNALEEEVTVYREQKVCLVCKGKISGFNNFICPKCNALYCEKCARALSEIENICWVCESPLDQSKPIQKEEREVIKIENREDIHKK